MVFLYFHKSYIRSFQAEKSVKFLPLTKLQKKIVHPRVKFFPQLALFLCNWELKSSDCRYTLCETGENSKLVHRRIAPKCPRFFLLFLKMRPSDEYDSAPTRKYTGHFVLFSPVSVSRAEKKTKKNSGPNSENRRTPKPVLKITGPGKAARPSSDPCKRQDFCPIVYESKFWLLKITVSKTFRGF